ncbi:hypothetical protein RN001_012991 [Aquatica leii]|uniref:Uncharacterized protein n=1 Tax=Aquatica leii TaxID=1421715 RepID=A0AAN7S6S4_9COLE|nr:hypothetical protein RN001_012991 [Aquatica leii]
MGVTSKTGLLASTTKRLIRKHQTDEINLKVIATSAPFAFKPLAGIYNPYPYGCSLLCNHPADTDARELLRRAKDTWATEGRNLLLSDEVEAIRASLNQPQVKVTDFVGDGSIPIDNVPEELFRRYTETDSRPLTPAPTLVSAHTRASGSRRCVTPDPMLNADVREKTQLILDLRRSHSQETFSCHGGLPQPELPVITIEEQDEHKNLCTPEALKKIERRSKTPSPVKTSKNEPDKVKTYLKVTATEDDADESEDIRDDEEDDGVVKRRGRRRRKRGRDSSRGPPAFQSSIDPETQVFQHQFSTIGSESHNPSARQSLVPTDSIVPEPSAVQDKPPRRDSLEVDSFLDKECLKLLCRELDDEVIDNELNLKRRRALQETMNTIKPKKVVCQDLKDLQKEMKELDKDHNLWLNTPRMFSRSGARFELPMDSRELSVMTPLEYVTEHVSVSNTRKQLYNYIFNRHKNENDLENEHHRILSGKNILPALNCVMSNNMSEEQATKFRELIGWKDEDNVEFKTFCGLSALCERLLAPEFPLLIRPKNEDPCSEIEAIDFKSLKKKIRNQNADKRLVKILYAIRDS